jgi:FkbM family methyltransferase
MGLLHDIKILIRSGSWDFMRTAKPGQENYDKPLYAYNWNKHPVYYRPGTSDRGLIYEILIRKPSKAEYYVDERVSPKVILDIGANVGITAIWLASKYPDATIYSFEPMQDNYELLVKNTAGYPNIRTYNFGLGEKTEEMDVFSNIDTFNRGGFSIYQRPNDPDNAGTEDVSAGKIQIRDAAEALKEIGITHIDLLKIDTEGAEYDIIRVIPEELIKDCQWVMGELHGIKTFETLALLDKWFGIEMKKRFTSEVFVFFGLNKNLRTSRKYEVNI